MSLLIPEKRFSITTRNIRQILRALSFAFEHSEYVQGEGERVQHVDGTSSFSLNVHFAPLKQSPSKPAAEATGEGRYTISRELEGSKEGRNVD